MDDHKLFVGNMAARITQRDLWRFFSPYGLIDECAKFHESYAFVRFVHAADARQARRETHGAILKGRKIKVEFAAALPPTSKKNNNNNNNNNIAPWQQQGYLYIQPLRRATNVPPPPSLHHRHRQQPTVPSPPPPPPPPCQTPTTSCNKTKMVHKFETPSPSSSSNNDDELLMPDLLRMAGIQYSSSDEDNDTYFLPMLNNTNRDSRFFPISANRNSFTSVQNDQQDFAIHLLSIDFARTRLFSDVSSGFGDDSHLFVE